MLAEKGLKADAMSNSKEVNIKYWMPAKEGTVLWASSLTFNGLLKIDLKLKTAKVESVFEDIPDSEGHSFFVAVKAADSIVFLPGSSNYIAIYSISKKNISKVFIPNVNRHCNEIYNEKDKFSAGIVVNNYVYILGGSFPGIIKLNVNTGEISEYYGWVDEIERFIPVNDAHYYFADGFVEKEGVILLFLSCCNAMLYINTKDDSMLIKHTDMDVDGFEGVTYADDRYWVIGRKNKNHFLLEVDFDGNCIRKKQIMRQSEEGLLGNLFLRPIVYGDTVMIIPVKGKHAYITDIFDKEVKSFDKMNEYLGSNNRVDIFCIYRSGDNISFWSNADCRFHDMNLLTGEITDYQIFLDDEDYLTERIRKKVNNHDLLLEEGSDLMRFISVLSEESII